MSARSIEHSGRLRGNDDLMPATTPEDVQVVRTRSRFENGCLTYFDEAGNAVDPATVMPDYGPNPLRVIDRIAPQPGLLRKALIEARFRKRMFLYGLLERTPRRLYPAVYDTLCLLKLL